MANNFLAFKIALLVTGIALPASYIVYQSSILGIFSAINAPSFFPKKDQCINIEGECNGNIYEMAKKVQREHPEELKYSYVVIISNDEREVRMMWQRGTGKCPLAEEVIVWNFHVIMVYSKSGSSWVLDLNTQLSFPCVFKTYCDRSFGSEHIKPERYFRVVSAKTYANHFKESPCLMYSIVRNREVNVKPHDGNMCGNVYDYEGFLKLFGYEK